MENLTFFEELDQVHENGCMVILSSIRVPLYQYMLALISQASLTHLNQVYRSISSMVQYP